MLPQTTPRPIATGDGVDQHHPLSENEWSNLFSTPLNPTMFAALAANGILGDSPPPSHYISTNSRPQVNHHGHGHGQTASWSHSSAAYFPSNSPYVHGTTIPMRPSTTNVPRDKGKSPVGHYTPPQPLPHDILPYETKATDERHLPGSISSRRRQSAQGSASLHNVGTSRQLNSRASYRNNGPFDASLNTPLSPGDYNPGYSGERSNIGLPPSLWMSPTSTTSSTSGTYSTLHTPMLSAISTSHPIDSSALSSYGQSPLSSTHSATDSKSTILSDLFSDDLFDPHSFSTSEHGASAFTSPRLSGSPDLKAAELAAANADPEALKKEDPLATQIWRMYARTKATLPHAQRMENLTWRMMAMALRKKKEEEDVKAPVEAAENQSPLVLPKEEPNLAAELPQQRSKDSDKDDDGNERGRGRGKVRVVGFDGANQDGQDGPEDDEYVMIHIYVRWRHAKRALL
jgi:GATA-binding protein